MRFIKQLKVVVLVAAAVAIAPAAFAQATRTWVSGVGDDANPCSRTAPCKTFPGAISKTAAGGEINALDPGGFGTVTITKSITIDGAGTHASILATGVTGVIVNAPTNETIQGVANTPCKVTLRNLSINGASTGVTGIRILTGPSGTCQTVNIENVRIQGFTTTGIRDERTAASSLNIIDTVVSNIRNNTASAAHGIQLQAATGAPIILALLDNVRSYSNKTSGLLVASGFRAIVKNSSFTNNAAGVTIQNNAGNVEATLYDTEISMNSVNGLEVLNSATARISDVTITNNNVNGILFSGVGATVTSFGNNYINGNGGNNGAGVNNIGPQ